MASKSYERNTRLYLLGILTAVELLMSFSFLGYLHVEPISITIAYIPVLLAGALVGLPEAVILGTVFGLASMWKAGASYVMPTDQLFSPFMSGRPMESVLLSVGARMLFGLLTGLLYLAAKRLPYTGAWLCVVSFFGKFLHSLLVYSAMGLFFPEAGYSVRNALDSFVSLNDVVTNLVTAGIVFLFWKLEKSRFWQEYRIRMEKAQKLQIEGHYHRLSMAAILLLTVGLTLAIAVYFVHRMDYALEAGGVILNDTNYSDLVHLQIQFVIGALSMMALVIVFLIFNRRNSVYMYYEAKIDALTGLTTRKAFFEACTKALQNSRTGREECGYFIMVDVDRFKEINDQYGHPESDRILREAASALQETFGREGLVGRVGGDEFAVLLDMSVSRERLEAIFSLFLKRIHTIEIEDSQISCSIGAVPLHADKPVDALYREADRMLYSAKRQGRDRFVLLDHSGEMAIIEGEHVQQEKLKG